MRAYPQLGSSNLEPAREIVLVHSSDLHLGLNHSSDDLHALRSVLGAAGRTAADVLLLAGDVFDHNRVPLEFIDRAARLLGDAPLPVVILPGNHDCLTPNSVYRRGGLAEPANVHVFGITIDEVAAFPILDLEIWGRPHLDHSDYSPLRDPRPRSARRTVATAHGHWVTGPHDHHRAWLIHDEEIAATGADYVALGHWDRALPVGDGSVPAYYSGSPDLARTVNVVRFTAVGDVEVTRVPLDAEQP
jgi:DNA repair exonuclease SbcCD nuclease subunit